MARQAKFSGRTVRKWPAAKPKTAAGLFLFRRLSAAQNYAIACVAVLLVTSTLWALLGAALHRSNADQLVDPYLFENSKTFNGAIFPSSHTQIVKWPIFWLIKAMGASSFAYALLTAAMVLTTVGFLAFVLYRIERRPLVFGTLCLGLASVLLLVPPMPYPGGLLPVNMAMITTRNLEYVLYIASLVLLIRSAKIKSWSFAAAALVMSLLIASDRLFAVISIGGALLAIIIYRLARRNKLMPLLTRWLAAGVVGVVVAMSLVQLLNSAGVTHITSQSNSGPYGLVHNFHDPVLGSAYAVLGLLTNFGANPAFDTSVLRQLPAQFGHRLFSLYGVSFLINFALLAVAFFIAYRLLRSTISRSDNDAADLGDPPKLSILLLWSSIAAFCAFIFTKHYYPVDARYLTICVFAAFIGLASYLRNRQFESEKNFVRAGAVIGLGIIIGLFFVIKTYNADRAALSGLDERNAKITEALRFHHVDVLVGDYWRVIPIRFASHKKVNVMPLAGCNQPLSSLVSKNWQYDLNNHSFAYVLASDKSLTDYKGCSLDQVLAAYGRPNSSVLTAGTIDKPIGQILFYDYGSNKSAPTINTTPKPSTVLPISLSQLPRVDCPPGHRIVINIVAHQDDDLLFMSPDLLHDLAAGDCVRSIYLTAGDAGASKLYWVGRERGSEAAYSYMLSSGAIWLERIVKLSDRQFITVANLRGSSQVSLIFVRLPDGGLTGSGFKATKYESLARLEAGQIAQMDSVDGQSSYNSEQLITTLTALMEVYRPSEIHTQATKNYSRKYPDHSDHLATGRFARQAYLRYENRDQIPIKYYIGYPIRERPANVSAEDYNKGALAFDAYNNFDSGVCQSIQECSASPTYGAYLKRQYTAPE